MLAVALLTVAGPARADPGGTVLLEGSSTVRAVALSASGIAYLDNQRTSIRGYRRSSVSPGVTIGGSSTIRLLDRDGNRTAFLDAAGDLWLVADDGIRTQVFDAEDQVALVADPAGLELSGTRLLWSMAVYTGLYCDDGCADGYFQIVPMLYDLRYGINVELRLETGAWEAKALWGGYLAYEGPNNSIRRQDLSSGRDVEVKPAGGPPVVSIAVHDDYVAWATCTPGTTSRCAESTVAYRNVATGTGGVVRTSDTSRVRLSGGHLEYDEGPILKVLRLGTRVTAEVGALRDRAFDVEDETLAWVGPDGVARIAPNSDFVAPPRFLGNALGAHVLTPNGDGSDDSWEVEFPISKALPECMLTITSDDAVLRVLPCGTADGTARASWDGRDAAGQPLPGGPYTWTLTGGDADGALRWYTGLATPITGTVVIG